MKPYFWQKFFYKIGHTFKSVYLCLRFPFLYPRNAWTGRHWNWWALDNRICNIYKEHTTFDKENFTVYWDNKWNRFRWNFLKRFEVFAGIFHCIPTYNMLDFMPDGWRKAFGIRLCEDIKNELLNSGGLKLLYSYRIIDIKEKWGLLRWDDTGGTKDLHKILAMYEDLSKHYCICCGELATCMTPVEYWRSPYCDNHFPKMCSCKLEYGTEQMPWYGHVGNIHLRSDEDWKAAQETMKDYIDGHE